MKRNLILAWRQLIIKGKLSVLQIFGITLGVTTSLLLCTYVNYHYSYDRFHNDLDQIYRVTSLQQQGDAIEHNALSPSGIAPLCESQIPGVVYSGRIARWIANDVVLSHHEQVIRDNQMLFVEPSFFQIFSFRLKRGSYSSLAEPNTIFLTESKAKALFGDEDPIEGEVMFENFKPFQVKGIIEDPPVNSHLQFSCIMSLRTLQDWGFDIFQNQEMTIPYVYTYLKLDKKTNAAQVAEQITNTVSTHQA
ncbi:MAG: ABC transporter permease, partial [Saprospiraceae bacterium]|nr:ABC transporter permease [Saprospiraceae bacterium]